MMKSKFDDWNVGEAATAVEVLLKTANELLHQPGVLNACLKKVVYPTKVALLLDFIHAKAMGGRG